MKNTPNRVLWAVLAFLTLSACESAEGGAKADEVKQPALNTAIEKGSYALGYRYAEGLNQQTFGVMDTEAFLAGARAALSGGPNAIPDNEAQEHLGALQAAVQVAQQKAAQEAAGEATAYRSEYAAKEGVVTLPSGLMYEVLKEGAGAKPGPTDRVTTHYHGTLISGEVFDSSVDRGQPASFAVNGVIKGWTEALQLMSVGSKWRLVIPPELAYGERGAGGLIGPDETLVFEVELLSID